MSAQKYRNQILNFLKSNPYIKKINFSFQGYKLYPSCYQIDIKNAIENEDIEITAKKLKGRVMAKYWDDIWILLCDDELVVSDKLNMSSVSDQSYIIHECTHAHLDYRNLGQMQRDLNEAICYTAQHTWLAAFDKANPGHKVALPQGRIHAAARNIANQVIVGKYNVDPRLAQALRHEIRSDPDYAKAIRRHPTVTSDGV
jgi:hypothetical protein